MRKSDYENKMEIQGNQHQSADMSKTAEQVKRHSSEEKHNQNCTENFCASSFTACNIERTNIVTGTESAVKTHSVIGELKRTATYRKSEDNGHSYPFTGTVRRARGKKVTPQLKQNCRQEDLQQTVQSLAGREWRR